MMAVQLYNPFQNFEFGGNYCFLSGQPLESPEEESLHVFPEWLMERYELRDKNFTMLGDGNFTKYANIKVPCAASVKTEAIEPLEAEIQKAFSEGYEAVKKLPKEKLFFWMGKLVYGVLYNDLRVAMQQQNIRGEQFGLSLYLQKKFSYLHLMLQGLRTPFLYEGFCPWSIEVVKVRYSKDVFNYKDETNNLNFSLGMYDFGIVACLQDNGENSRFHKELVAQIGEQVLHPIQFEELCGRFIYSNYLITKRPDYQVVEVDPVVKIETTMPQDLPLSQIFGHWEDEMFGQVLANYWKPWGIGMKDIVVFPNPPISFLLNEYTDELISADSITLPY
jgi:hypothetical protein